MSTYSLTTGIRARGYPTLCGGSWKRYLKRSRINRKTVWTRDALLCSMSRLASEWSKIDRCQWPNFRSAVRLVTVCPTTRESCRIYRKRVFKDFSDSDSVWLPPKIKQAWPNRFTLQISPSYGPKKVQFLVF